MLRNFRAASGPCANSRYRRLARLARLNGHIPRHRFAGGFRGARRLDERGHLGERRLLALRRAELRDSLRRRRLELAQPHFPEQADASELIAAGYFAVDGQNITHRLRMSFRQGSQGFFIIRQNRAETLVLERQLEA